MSLNSVNIMGNLTRDPELKYTTSGKTVCGLSIANSIHFMPKKSGAPSGGSGGGTSAGSGQQQPAPAGEAESPEPTPTADAVAWDE